MVEIVPSPRLPVESVVFEIWRVGAALWIFEAPVRDYIEVEGIWRRFVWWSP